MAARRFGSAEVGAVFAAYPAPLRKRLMALRALILKTAASLPDVGAVAEALRWGQPSYLTETSGSTVRIDALKSGEGYAAYFHCRSGLVPEFKMLYGDRFRFDGNRAIVFGLDEAPPVEMEHCIALALTHHARKRTSRFR